MGNNSSKQCFIMKHTIATDVPMRRLWSSRQNIHEYQSLTTKIKCSSGVKKMLFWMLRICQASWICGTKSTLITDNLSRYCPKKKRLVQKGGNTTPYKRIAKIALHGKGIISNSMWRNTALSKTLTLLLGYVRSSLPLRDEAERQRRPLARGRDCAQRRARPRLRFSVKISTALHARDDRWPTRSVPAEARCSLHVRQLRAAVTCLPRNRSEDACMACLPSSQARVPHTATSQLATPVVLFQIASVALSSPAERSG